jgi:predicted GNAT family acetyltransferase
MTEDVINNETRQRYELHTGGGIAAVYYEPRGDALAFVHTVVPERLQGQGIASALIKAALADVRRRGLKVIAECQFVVRYIEHHPEERDLLAE